MTGNHNFIYFNAVKVLCGLSRPKYPQKCRLRFSHTHLTDAAFSGILTSYVLWKKGKIQVVDKEQK